MRSEQPSLRLAASNGYRIPLGSAGLLATLHALGYTRDAERVTRSLEMAVDRHAYHEYYNPLIGRGLADRGFGFSTLLTDLLARSGIDVSELSAAGRIMAP